MQSGHSDSTAGLASVNCVRVFLAAAAEHAQQFTGVHALLLSHLLYIKAHVHEELDDVHLLPGELVSDGGTGGVTVWPGATVDQMHRTSFWRGLVVPVVLQAAVPAVQSPGQRSPLYLNVYPVRSCDYFM